MKCTHPRWSLSATLLAAAACGDPGQGGMPEQPSLASPRSVAGSAPQVFSSAAGEAAPGDSPRARALLEQWRRSNAAWFDSTGLGARLRASAAATSAAASAAASPEAAAPLSVSLPESADGIVALRERSSGLALQVRLREAQAAAREKAGALALYAQGAGEHAALIYASSELAFEDYVAFAVRPAAPEVHYEVELSQEVAGLRLVANTLEFLDGAGIPRVRVSPPFLVGADGARTDAALSVAGCHVDRNPAPPWGRAPVAPGAARCGLRVSWDEAGLLYPALLDPVWSSTASMATARQSFGMLALASGAVLVAGGLAGSPPAPIASAELFDPVSRTWSATGSLATARSAFTLTAQGSSRALAAAGLAAEGPLRSTEAFDELSGSWSPGPELAVAYAGHSAVRLDDGSILVAGGDTSRAAARLAPGASSWTAAGELLADQPGSTLSALSSGEVLLVGPNAPSAQLWSAPSGWREAARPVFAHFEHSATRLQDGRVLIVGGRNSRGAELYDPQLGSFVAVGATSEPHARHSASLLADGRVVVVGGVGVEGASGTETYNPIWGTWITGPGTAQGRASHAAALLPGGEVLVAGGIAPGGEGLASADVLDATRVPTVLSEYKFPASRDPDVTSSTFTELWAVVARPAALVPHRRYPVLLFLHGNHATCGTGSNPRNDIDCMYTDTGTCPPGFVPVPSHRGYDYVTEELAARGYIVVSVNANRGINCGGSDPEDFSMNLARGRLLLKHLQRLSEWNRGVAETPASIGASLEGQLDLTQLGIMGHSRGGEGARAAHEQLRDPGSPWPRRIGEPVAFRAIFEIGPVDGQTPRTLNADGTAWNVLLPMCDGDVSDLQGVRAFDRMLAMASEPRDAFKGSYTAWGTNHNYFNSEWQQSDSPGCLDHLPLFSDGPGITGSAEQRQIGLRALLAFFSANVGRAANPSLNELFDPTTPIAFHTRIERAYTPALRPNRGITLEDFTSPSGVSGRGVPHVQTGVSVVHTPVIEHDNVLRAANVSWDGSSAERFFEVRFSAVPAGLDLSRYTHLEFRAGRAGPSADPARATPVTVQLINADGSLSSPLALDDYGIRLDGPVGGPFSQHTMLQSVRLRLLDFPAGTPRAVRGVRFGFPLAEPGNLFIANLRAGLGTGTLSPVQSSGARARATTTGSSAAAGVRSSVQSQVVPGTRPLASRQRFTAGNRVIALRTAANNRLEIELETQNPFAANDDQLVLDIGALRSAHAQHPGGNLRRVVFNVDAQRLLRANKADRLQVRYSANDARQWDFGSLEDALRR